MKKIKYGILALAALPLLASCSEDWLDPKPLSFYTPENTYVDAAGLYSALVACERQMRHEYLPGTGTSPIMTEMYLSDVAVFGKTDNNNGLTDLDQRLIPSINRSSENGCTTWYWDEGFKGVKYANIVISRLDNATFKDEAERNAVLGNAYFQRAYRYYKLTHQYGDVPWLDKEITQPKLDFYTHDRWSILEQLQKDLEFAYQWVPEQTDRGRGNKDACGMLLMKVSMALGDFDRAIEVGREVVSRHPLMTQRFALSRLPANYGYQTLENTNLMFDLHSVEAKVDMGNTEGIMYVVAYPNSGETTDDQILLMRYALPYWASSAIKTPDGKNGTQSTTNEADRYSYLDNDIQYGRGIGIVRPTNYYQYEIWGEKELNDMRGPYNHDSWKRLTDLYYNNWNLKTSGSEWYGKLIQPQALSTNDSIRCWYMWPHYKLFVPDPTRVNDIYGGETPWYIYRSAETYLMLAECYYWKGDDANAAAMLNMVRERAGAEPLTGKIGIADVLAERARELYYEENRHVELVRISYLYAKTGKACEAFGNHVYQLDNISGPGGAGTFCKDSGVNFYFDWMMLHNNFFREKVDANNFGTFKISTHHLLWPVPETAITTNTGGVINQNIGYPGAENNITPLKVGEEAPGI